MFMIEFDWFIRLSALLMMTFGFAVGISSVLKDFLF